MNVSHYGQTHCTIVVVILDYAILLEPKWVGTLWNSLTTGHMKCRPLCHCSFRLFEQTVAISVWRLQYIMFATVKSISFGVMKTL